MKHGFVNQKLGKRMSRKAGLHKAKLAVSKPAPPRGRELREQPRRPH